MYVYLSLHTTIYNQNESEDKKTKWQKLTGALTSLDWFDGLSSWNSEFLFFFFILLQNYFQKLFQTPIMLQIFR